MDFATNPASSFYTLDFTDEFFNTGLVIPTTGYSGSIFSLKWSAATPVGLTGTGMIELGADFPAEPPSITQAFSASVSVAAPAALMLTLNNAEQTGSPGSSLTFNSTITNISTNSVYLNGAIVDLPLAGLSVDTSLQTSNFPLLFASQQSVTGDLFTVTIAPDIALGNYFGSITLLGGLSPIDQNELGSQNFLVIVNVPEPGALSLMIGTVGFGLSLGIRRRKHSRDIVAERPVSALNSQILSSVSHS